MKETTNERAVEAVEVIQADRNAAIEADDGAINVARSLADRMCGASQSEMRQARKTYLAEAFARHRIASVAAARPFIMEEAAGMVQARYDKAPWNAMGDQFKAAIEDLRTAAKTDGGGA